MNTYIKTVKGVSIDDVERVVKSEAISHLFIGKQLNSEYRDDLLHRRGEDYPLIFCEVKSII